MTFGNKLFDYAHNYAALQKARNSNESLGKILSKIQENVTSIIDSNNNRKMWKIGVVKE